jgi:hypothetical protein
LPLNERLWAKTGQAKIEDEIMKRKLRWISHTSRKPQGIITRNALSWNSQYTRKKEDLRTHGEVT